MGNSVKYGIKRNCGDIDSNTRFKYIYEVCNSFGKNYKGFQRGYCNLPFEEAYALWFPKFYENSIWKNELRDNKKFIFEKFIGDLSRSLEILEANILKHRAKRVVFTKKNGMYEFIGIYEIQPEMSRKEGCSVYKRINETIEKIND
ncbi:TPA: hypothetical protein I9094_002013 [Clostridium perfringens]|nr:hypothetical protein [Clostridium perfringens]HAT4346537.1 hypothetical protein [Clostridium perfringens]